MSEWQPIETAPQGDDFRRFLLVHTLDRWVYIGRWNPSLGDDGLWEAFDDVSSMPDEQPTHWQPLPESPK